MATKKMVKPKLVFEFEDLIPEFKGEFRPADFYKKDSEFVKIGYLGRRFRRNLQNCLVLKSQKTKEFQVFRLMQNLNEYTILNSLSEINSNLESFTVNLYFVSQFLNKIVPKQMYLFLINTDEGIEFLLIDKINGSYEFTQSPPTDDMFWKKSILLVLGF